MKKSTHEPKNRDSYNSFVIRYKLARYFVFTVALFALISLVKPTAVEIVDKLIPVLLVIIGYYFGQKDDGE